MGGGHVMPRIGPLTPGKDTWFPLYRKLEGLCDWSEWVWKILLPWASLYPGPSSLKWVAVLTMLSLYQFKSFYIVHDYFICLNPFDTLCYGPKH